MTLYRNVSINRTSDTSRGVGTNRETPLPIKRPDVVYLTLGGSAPSEMYVTYHISSNAVGLNILYRLRGSDSWEEATPKRVPFQNEDKNIFHTLLKNLEGDAEYEFNIGGDTDNIYRFKTLPESLTEPIKIAFGSDFHHGYNTFYNNLNTISNNDCRLFVFGGDFVDDDGLKERSYRWVEFWDNVAHRLVDSEGRLIPWVAIIGNHEFAPFNEMENLFFHDMFPHPKPNPKWSIVDIGDYLTFYLIDFVSLGYVWNGDRKWKRINNEEQIRWLREVMQERTDRPYNIPLYHTAFYSSDRAIYLEDERIEYKHIFRENNIKLGLCGHDHVYKKTHKLKINGLAEDDEVAGSGEDGFIEIGDGGMADKLYDGDRVGEWYIDTYAIHKPHVNIIKLEFDKMTIEAKGTDGKVFDSTVINA